MSVNETAAVLPPLVAAKTARPRMVRGGVSRPDVTALLEAADRQAVTLVCAGAGWGKTMAVSQWARERREPVAWLSLDRHDNDPQIFWSYVLAAFRVAGAISADNPLAGLGSIPPDELERGGRLIDGLARMPSGTVLVIDDLQEIDDADVLQGLTNLLRRQPPALRLVLIARAEPALRLHRLRAAGALAEIRTEHLAFTPDEAADLIAGHGLSLSGGDVTTLLERTEGWATGLQLGAAFLAVHDGVRTITDFAGDIRGVEAYLTEEVIADRTRRQRRFLLQTSISENLCAGLANAITQGNDGQRILEQLEHGNDFVVRLGEKPLWFRYHHLLRDVLGHRLMLESSAAVPHLHRRAARWHAANNSVIHALTHAVSGQDWPYVGRLVTTQAAPLMVSAHRSALVKILQQVPFAQLGSTPELMICAALLLFHSGDYDAIPARLEAARAQLHNRPASAREPVEVMSHILQLAADRAVGDMPAVIAGSGRLLDLLADARSVAVPAVVQNRAIALNNKGLALLWTGHVGEAERHLWAASNAARSAGLELTEINATGHLALLRAMSGSVEEAGRLSAGAVGLADRRGWRYALQTVAAHLALALVHLERDEIGDARQALDDGLRAHLSDPEAAQRLVALGVQARLATVRGDTTDARQLLHEARQDRNPRLHVPAIDRWLTLVEARLDLVSGRPQRVEHRYAGPQPQQLDAAEQLCLAHAAYVEGDYRRAGGLLAAVVPAHRDAVTRTDAGILGALVADARGQGVRAADLLNEVVALAAGEGIRRPFTAMAGPRLDGLLRRLQLLTQGDKPANGSILDGLRTVPEQSNGVPPAEPLSEREYEVLRYLTTMLTAAEIATELGLSVNTVKAHMRAVYRKLGSTRRSEAVTRARQIGVL
jgi:LuxR family maltose regulon positive regulatory protein